jgi:hypothetical protein
MLCENIWAYERWGRSGKETGKYYLSCVVIALFCPNLDGRLIYEQELSDRCLHKAQHCQLLAEFCINVYSILWLVLALCRMPNSTFAHNVGPCKSII